MLKYILLAALTSCAAPAHAIDCHPAQDVWDELKASDYEAGFIGSAKSGEQLMIFVNNLGWVSIVENPDGTMCILGGGTDWHLRPSGVPA